MPTKDLPINNTAIVPELCSARSRLDVWEREVDVSPTLGTNGMAGGEASHDVRALFDYNLQIVYNNFEMVDLEWLRSQEYGLLYRHI